MEIKLIKEKTALAFTATDGKAIAQLSAGTKYGGTEDALSPMQLVLSSLGACMSIDVVLILKKQKQTIENYEVNITGKRADSTPAVFTDVNVHITVTGQVEESKLKKAIQLSEEKYCSVSDMLKNSVNITTSCSVISTTTG